MKYLQEKYQQAPLQPIQLENNTGKKSSYSLKDKQKGKKDHKKMDNNNSKKSEKENPVFSSLKKSIQESSLQHPMLFWGATPDHPNGQQQQTSENQFQQYMSQSPYSLFQDPSIFESRNNDFISQSLKMQFPQLPQHVAMMLLQNKTAFENMFKMQKYFEQQQMESCWQQFIMQQQYQQQQMQLQQNQPDKQQQEMQQKQMEYMKQFQQQQMQQMQSNLRQQQQQQSESIQESSQDNDMMSNHTNSSSFQNQKKSVLLHKKISKNSFNSNSKQNLSMERSKEQQKKDREETKNILRNTGNAIKNFHKDMECREIVEKLLDGETELVNRYYGDFLPQKLEKFEDFQEIWNVDNVDDEIYVLKTAFRKVCWIFMESYFFQYFFHKSRCQKESLRALVKFRHRFMEGIVDPECFHYFKKIGSK